MRIDLQDACARAFMSYRSSSRRNQNLLLAAPSKPIVISGFDTDISVVRYWGLFADWAIGKAENRIVKPRGSIN